MTALFLKPNENDTNDIKLNRAKTKKVNLRQKSIKRKMYCNKKPKTYEMWNHTKLIKVWLMECTQCKIFVMFQVGKEPANLQCGKYNRKHMYVYVVRVSAYGCCWINHTCTVALFSFSSITLCTKFQATKQFEKIHCVLFFISPIYVK